MWTRLAVLLWAWAWVAWAKVVGDLRSSDPYAPPLVDPPIYDPNSLPNIPLGNPTLMEFDQVGEALTPQDFIVSQGMAHDPVDISTSSDPIMLAGLLEGDIQVMTRNELYFIMQDTPMARNAIIMEDKKWPNGIIPYVISSSYTKEERATIAKGMVNFHDLTCLRFVPRDVERDYIHILKGDGCSSAVGRVGGAQAVTLGQGCLYPGVVMHELNHAAGFWHEHSRPDRAGYIQIVESNIQKGMHYNFQTHSWQKIQNLGIGYDLGSIMHYGQYAFAKNRNKRTIIPVRDVEIGQRRALSVKDQKKINLLYCGKETGGGTGGIGGGTGGGGGEGGSVLPACNDKDKYCRDWAKTGECRKNPAYMELNCCIACSQVNKGKCKDDNKFCPKWANTNQCTENPSYMNRNCKKSCGMCKTPGAIKKPPTKQCVDENQHCAAWAGQRQCYINPSYMIQSCPKSCGKC